MSRVRLLAAMSLIVALAVALVVALAQQRSSDGTTPTGISAPEPTRSETTPLPEPVPTPDNTGRDFDRIWREVQRFNDWAYMHPEVGLSHIHLIYHPECPCYTALKESLSLALQNGVHFEDLVTRVESVVVTSDLGEAARIETRMAIAPRRVVNAQGVTLQSDQGVPSRDFAANLELQSDGRWLVRTISMIEPS